MRAAWRLAEAWPGPGFCLGLVEMAAYPRWNVVEGVVRRMAFMEGGTEAESVMRRCCMPALHGERYFVESSSAVDGRDAPPSGAECCGRRHMLPAWARSAAVRGVGTSPEVDTVALFRVAVLTDECAQRARP